MKKRPPSRVRMLATGLLGGLGALVVSSLFAPVQRAAFSRSAAAGWLVTIACFAALAGLFALFVLLARRRAGEQGRLMRQAFRTGEVPDGADVERWRRDFQGLLARPQLSGFFLIAGFLLLLLGFGPLIATNDWRLSAILATSPAIILAASIAAFPLIIRRRRDRVQQLLDQLPDDPDHDPDL